MSDGTPTREYAALEDEIDLDHLDEKQKAIVRLALVDADLARWLVYDGQLSERPLDRVELGPVLRELREVDMDGLNNEPTNLAVAHSRTEHVRWHASLNPLVAELMRRGILGFNEAEGYVLIEDAA